jgi:hypothetical protein
MLNGRIQGNPIVNASNPWKDDRPIFQGLEGSGIHRTDYEHTRH